jgi:hypothetical protein
MSTQKLQEGATDAIPKSADLGAGAKISTVEPHPVGRVKHSKALQTVRLLVLVSWVMGCCVTTHITQLLGTPLYVFSRETYYAWMALTKQSFGLLITTITQWFSPTTIRVSGDKSVRGQLKKTSDGRLEVDFPERLVLIANHQLYSDWLYLWWISYAGRMHGHIYIILKESLKYIPIAGPGMMFFGFIFMARNWVRDSLPATCWKDMG